MSAVEEHTSTLLKKATATLDGPVGWTLAQIRETTSAAKRTVEKWGEAADQVRKTAAEVQSLVWEARSALAAWRKSLPPESKD